MQTGSLNKQICSIPRLICLPVIAVYFLLAGPWFSNARGETTPTSTWFVEMNKYSNAAHTGIKCEECHGLMAEMGKPHPDPKDPGYLKREIKRSFDYQQCQKCHKKSYERFITGEHAKALEKEKTSGEVSKTGPSPTCGDCHSAHYAPPHLSRIQSGIIMTGTCGTCHPDQEKSFLENFHGKAAVNLEYEKSAFCTDCHGAHECLSLKDKKEALKACRRCHTDAQEQFADIIIHDTKKYIEKKSDVKKAGLNIVHLLGGFSLIFIIVLLVFFYTHSSILMLRKIHEKLRKHK